MRVERLGAGLCLPGKAYTVEKAAVFLTRLLSEPGFAVRAAEAASLLRKEDGLTTACDAIESFLEKLGQEYATI